MAESVRCTRRGWALGAAEGRRWVLALLELLGSLPPWRGTETFEAAGGGRKQPQVRIDANEVLRVHFTRACKAVDLRPQASDF
jgi:hypothetical protein